jgi:DNA-binding LacI/PurR family transcriptional regulator/transcriptional regulator with XRE-family HTH domain
MQRHGTFGQLLQSHRLNRDLTQAELAELAGYTSASRHAIVSRIENAPRDDFANADQVARLVRALHKAHPFTLTEIHQLATTYLGLDVLSTRGERSQLAVAIGGIVFSSFWSGVVAHLVIHAGSRYHLVLRPHGEDLGSEQEILRSFAEQSHGLYGVLLAPAQGLYRGPSTRQMEIRRELIRRLQENGVPVVLVDRCLTEADQHALVVRAPLVSLDHYDAGRKAVRKLCEAGHRHIGVLLDLEHDQVQQQRRQGIVDELRAQGIEPDRRFIIHGTSGQKVDHSALEDSPFGYHNIRINAGSLLTGRAGVPRPTALLCTTSYATIETYTAIVRDHRLSIPDEVSLLGFDAVGELRRLGISRVPYSPRETASYALAKMEEQHDPARARQASHDHLWHVSYADSDWAIATHEEPGTIKNITEDHT